LSGQLCNPFIKKFKIEPSLKFERAGSTHFLFPILMNSVTLTNTAQGTKIRDDQSNTQSSPFQNNPTRSGFPDRVLAALFGSSFGFVVNDAVIGSDVAEAVTLSVFVRERLSVDICACGFVILDGCVESSGISSIQMFFSGSEIAIGVSDRLLSFHFGNGGLEHDFLCCAKAGIAATLSGSVIERQMNFKSEDLSDLSFEGLDDLLLRYAVPLETEDELLKIVLKLGLGYDSLLRHIQIGFLSDEGVSLFANHFDIVSESVWELTAAVISHPLPCSVQLDSLIISSFPEIFAEFGRK
jgi:hypothetical protein